MESGSGTEDEQRRAASAFQLRQRGMSHNLPSFQGRPAEHMMNGGESSQQTRAVGGTGGGGGEPHPGMGAPSPSSVEDNEFESFHRSFTVGATLLDSLAASRPSSDANTARAGGGGGGSDQVTSLSTSPPTLGSARLASPQEAQESQLNDEEDPTVVQARKSMMARTGDRHARGKLPGPKEGSFPAPDGLPVEPQMPNARSSKRYLKHKERSLDVFDGIPQTDTDAILKENEHIVTCNRCHADLLVIKAAVAVRCKPCGEISPALSRNRPRTRYATG